MNIPISHSLLQTDDGVLLPYLHYSRPNQAADKLLIYIHGAGSSSIVRQPSLTNTLASTLSTAGVDLLTFNNRGAGYITKFDTVDGGVLVGGMAYERIAESVHDINAALSWAKNTGYKKVYLAGHSTGANKLVYWSSHTEKKTWPLVDSILLIGGGDDVSLQRNRYSTDQLQSIMQQIQDNKTTDESSLVPASLFPGAHPISWRSLVELLSPGSDYDAFPFTRASGTSAFEMFRDMHHANIAVIYGSEDFGTILPPQDALSLLLQIRSITPYLLENVDHNFTKKELELSETIRRHIENPTP